MLSVFLQPGAPRAVRAGLQPRELPAPVRAPERGLPLVTYQHPVEAHKDWSQDYQSLQDDRFPDGGGGGTGEAVPVDAFSNSPPGEGMRESARLEPVNAASAIRWSKTRDNCLTTMENQTTWGRHDRAGQRTGGKRRSTVPERARFVVGYRHWRRHMKDTG